MLPEIDQLSVYLPIELGRTLRTHCHKIGSGYSDLVVTAVAKYFASPYPYMEEEKRLLKQLLQQQDNLLRRVASLEVGREERAG